MGGLETLCVALGGVGYIYILLIMIFDLNVLLPEAFLPTYIFYQFF